MTPVATIVIPNFNGMRFLPTLLESLAAQSRSDFRVIVVDDVSTDGGPAWIRQHRPDVTLIENPRNLGFAGTCNVGLGRADTPYCVLLNNDTCVDRRWFECAVTEFDDRSVGSVASLVLLADEPGRIDTAGDLFSVAGGAVKRLHGEPRERAIGAPREVFSACAASAFFRTDALREVGLFDDSFVSYYEDVELGFRLQLAGWRCVFAPDSICHHHLGSSYEPDGWSMRFNSARNSEIVWWACMPARLRWRYLASHAAFLGMQLAAQTIRGRGGRFIAGKLAALCRAGPIRRKRAAIRGFARCGDEQLASVLVRDWWGLHVRPRLPRRLGGTTQ